MSGYTSFTLPSGAEVLVQSSLPAPPARKRGVAKASGAVGKARDTWAEGMELVEELARGVVDKLAAAAKAADEVAVEFGVTISGKTGVILVEGSAAANLKVTIKFKPNR
jgi:hypothetical protein